MTNLFAHFLQISVGLMLIFCTSVAQSFSYQISGNIVQSEGVFDSLLPIGSVVSGALEIDDSAIADGFVEYSDITHLEIHYGDFCLSLSLCSGTIVPFTFGSAEIGVDSSGELTGGFIEAVSQGPTDINLFMFLDLDLLVINVVICGLICLDNTVLLSSFANIQVVQVVPIPASIWLFSVALAALWPARFLTDRVGPLPSPAGN